MLEPCEVKVSRTVLRGLGAGNSPWLPGQDSQAENHRVETSAPGGLLKRAGTEASTTEESREETLHAGICAEGAGRPVSLPRCFYKTGDLLLILKLFEEEFIMAAYCKALSYLSIIVILRFFILSSLVYAQTYTWTDFTQPFTRQLCKSGDEKFVTIEVSLPHSIIQKYEKIPLVFTTYDADKDKAYIKVNDSGRQIYHFFGTYANKTTTEERVKIKTKHLKMGRNKLSFGSGKTNRYYCVSNLYFDVPNIKTFAKKATPRPTMTPKPRPTPRPTARPTVTPIPTPIPRPTLTPTPIPTPTPRPTSPPPTPTPTPSRIEQLLEKAESYFDQKWFMTPEDKNAFDVYKEVLRIDPANDHARGKLHDMMRMYKNWGDNNYRQGNYDHAKTFYQRYLVIAEYRVNKFADYRVKLTVQEVQKQLHELEATPTSTPHLPTPMPLPPTPAPIPQPDELLSITVTSEIPAETERETLEIHIIVTSDKGVKDVKVTVGKPGTKGFSIGTIEEGERGLQKKFTFSKHVPLEIGHNVIMIEATDMMGQIAQRVFPVIRKVATGIAVKIPPNVIQRPGDVYAVIIGIGDYQDDRLDLQFTVNDAQGLYDVLTDPRYGGVPKDHITLLLDQEATDRSIKRAMGTWLCRQAKKDDTVIIYYSGHGAPEGEDTYWVTYDADIDDLFSTALNSTTIADMLDKIESERVITFLDSCYSASTVQKTDRTRDLQRGIPWDKFSGKGRLVISASDGKQLSLELEKYQHGVFTYYLLKGLKGQADENHDGVIAVDEIWDYVKYQVAETARKAGNPQTPVRQGVQTAGIPLTFNLSTLREKQQQHIKRQKQEALQKLYEQGLITPEHFDCALKILDSGTPNRYLKDLLSGKITPETFGRFFQCDFRK